MNLYIQIENGSPINHPAYEENLIQAFGSIPSHWESFVRVDRPKPTTYQVDDGSSASYQKIDNVWTDVWTNIREMTAEEVAAKQEEEGQALLVTRQTVIDAWAVRPYASNFTAWTFDEASVSYKPPTPRPSIGNYRWYGPDNNWREAPPQPENASDFNFTTWEWIPLTED